MAGIKRFITYIYAYENGTKGINAGFAKVEIRGNECRIEDTENIGMRTFHCLCTACFIRKTSRNSRLWLSRFWMYFPVPLAGIAMIIFEIEALYNHIKSFFVKEEN